MVRKKQYVSRNPRPDPPIVVVVNQPKVSPPKLPVQPPRVKPVRRIKGPKRVGATSRAITARNLLSFGIPSPLNVPDQSDDLTEPAQYYPSKTAADLGIPSPLPVPVPHDEEIPPPLTLPDVQLDGSPLQAFEPANDPAIPPPLPVVSDISEVISTRVAPKRRRSSGTSVGNNRPGKTQKLNSLLRISKKIPSGKRGSGASKESEESSGSVDSVLDAANSDECSPRSRTGSASTGSFSSGKSSGLISPGVCSGSSSVKPIGNNSSNTTAQESRCLPQSRATKRRPATAGGQLRQKKLSPLPKEKPSRRLRTAHGTKNSCLSSLSVVGTRRVSARPLTSAALRLSETRRSDPASKRSGGSVEAAEIRSVEPAQCPTADDCIITSVLSRDARVTGKGPATSGAMRNLEENHSSRRQPLPSDPVQNLEVSSVVVEIGFGLEKRLVVQGNRISLKGSKAKKTNQIVDKFVDSPRSPSPRLDDVVDRSPSPGVRSILSAGSTGTTKSLPEEAILQETVRGKPPPLVLSPERSSDWAERLKAAKSIRTFSTSPCDDPVEAALEQERLSKMTKEVFSPEIPVPSRRRNVVRKEKIDPVPNFQKKVISPPVTSEIGIHSPEIPIRRIASQKPAVVNTEVFSPEIPMCLPKRSRRPSWKAQSGVQPAVAVPTGKSSSKRVSKTTQPEITVQSVSTATNSAEQEGSSSKRDRSTSSIRPENLELGSLSAPGFRKSVAKEPTSKATKQDKERSNSPDPAEPSSGSSEMCLSFTSYVSPVIPYNRVPGFDASWVGDMPESSSFDKELPPSPTPQFQRDPDIEPMVLDFSEQVAVVEPEPVVVPQEIHVESVNEGIVEVEPVPVEEIFPPRNPPPVEMIDEIQIIESPPPSVTQLERNDSSDKVLPERQISVELPTKDRAQVATSSKSCTKAASLIVKIPKGVFKNIPKPAGDQAKKPSEPNKRATNKRASRLREPRPRENPVVKPTPSTSAEVAKKMDLELDFYSSNSALASANFTAVNFLEKFKMLSPGSQYDLLEMLPARYVEVKDGRKTLKPGLLGPGCAFWGKITQDYQQHLRSGEFDPGRRKLAIETMLHDIDPWKLANLEPCYGDIVRKDLPEKRFLKDLGSP